MTAPDARRTTRLVTRLVLAAIVVGAVVGAVVWASPFFAVRTWSGEATVVVTELNAYGGDPRPDSYEVSFPEPLAREALDPGVSWSVVRLGPDAAEARVGDRLTCRVDQRARFGEPPQTRLSACRPGDR